MTGFCQDGKNSRGALRRSAGTNESFVERGFQYPERDYSLLLACSFYTHSISPPITCHSIRLVYVIEFSAY